MNLYVSQVQRGGGQELNNVRFLCLANSNRNQTTRGDRHHDPSTFTPLYHTTLAFLMFNPSPKPSSSRGIGRDFTNRPIAICRDKLSCNKEHFYPLFDPCHTAEIFRLCMPANWVYVNARDRYGNTMDRRARMLPSHVCGQWGCRPINTQSMVVLNLQAS